MSILRTYPRLPTRGFLARTCLEWLSRSLSSHRPRCSAILEPTLCSEDGDLKPLVFKEPGHAEVKPVRNRSLVRVVCCHKVRMVGFCGSNLNSFRGRPPGVRPANSRARSLSHDRRRQPCGPRPFCRRGCNPVALRKLCRAPLLPPGHGRSPASLGCVERQSVPGQEDHDAPGLK
jgi:hypothetical protein